MNSNHTHFNHEKLEVYQLSLQFIEWLNPLWNRIRRNKNIADQLDRASISVPLNLAEGNGKSYPKDRRRYFEIARGSALECSSCLDVITIKRLLNKEDVVEGQSLLLSIVKMTTKLSQSALNKISEDKFPTAMTHVNKYIS